MGAGTSGSAPEMNATTCPMSCVIGAWARSLRRCRRWQALLRDHGEAAQDEAPPQSLGPLPLAVGNNGQVF